MSAARWTKAYVGMHSVEYSGFYCGQVICGDWTLALARVDFGSGPLRRLEATSVTPL